MTESEYQILLAAIVEASDVRYDAAKVVLTKLMGESVKPEQQQADHDRRARKHVLSVLMQAWDDRGIDFMASTLEVMWNNR